MSKRRRYSQEFKRGAVEQCRHPGVSCAQVARELGIGANLLTRWNTLEWVDWFNYRRLLEPIGNVPPSELEAAYYRQLEESAKAA